MFKIESGTRVAMARVEEDKYIARLISFVKQQVPAMAAVPPQQMHADIRVLIARARTFDMHSEAALAAYVVTAALLGLDFVDRFRGARQILFSSETEERKAKLLQGFAITLFERLGRPA